MPHLKSKSKRVSIRKCLMEKMERKTEFAVLPPKTRIKNLHSFKGLFFFCCHLMKFHFLFWQKQMVNNVSMPSTLKVSKFQMQLFLFSFEPKTERNYFLISAQRMGQMMADAHFASKNTLHKRNTLLLKSLTHFASKSILQSHNLLLSTPCSLTLIGMTLKVTLKHEAGVKVPNQPAL